MTLFEYINCFGGLSLLMDDFLFYLVSGLCIGAIYALIALGYTLVYGIIKLINFAHGEFYMAGAYAGYGIYILLPAPMPVILKIFIVLAASGVASALLSSMTEKLAYKPIRKSGRLAALLTALGMAFLLQNLAAFINNGRALLYPADDPGSIGALAQISVDVGGSGIRVIKFCFILVAVVLTGILWYIVMKTRFGRAMRAVSQDPDAAALMGINIDSVINRTFIMGGFMAGIAGTLIAFQSVIEPSMGFMPGLKAFIAAVLGGIGSVPGAVLGGFLIGIIENLVVWMGVPTGYKDVAALLVLIIVLILRPQGLLGKVEREKV